jgi:hypothetical protein
LNKQTNKQTKSKIMKRTEFYGKWSRGCAACFKNRVNFVVAEMFKMNG